MTIQLDHLIVPSKDRVAAARQLAGILGVPWAEQGAFGPFSPVYVSDSLTLDFDQWGDSAQFPVQHYCFRVDTITFQAILARLQAAGIAYRSTPHGHRTAPRTTKSTPRSAAASSTGTCRTATSGSCSP